MNNEIIKEGVLIWEPSEKFKEQSNMMRFMRGLKKERGLDFNNYSELLEWSVTRIEDFWESIWKFFDIKSSRPYSEVLSQRKMPGAAWFKGSELNYAEHVFRNMTTDRPAILFQSEIQPLIEVSWDELFRKVSSVAANLRKMGVKRGDRVVAYIPNIPEALIAFLASASIGAIWSSSSPDFGSQSVIDRFKQIEPKVLFAVNGYGYGGKLFDRIPTISVLQDSLPTLEKTVLINYLDQDNDLSKLSDVVSWDSLLDNTSSLEYEQVPFEHPLWILYSSGTTGLPKPIVQGHGGIVIELMKFLSIQIDLKPEDRFFWFTTTGWVMWNILISGLLTGSSIVMFDGNPGYPDMWVLWKLAEKAGVTLFGTGAPFLTSCMKAGIEPGKTLNLDKIKGVGSTGSPLPPEGFKWVYDSVKSDILLASVCGGTDICTAFLGGSPILPVYSGELQCNCLGVKAEAFSDDGNSLIDEVGELVITEPMPSMPLYFWNDPDNKRYNESYFELYPGLWRHGDWIKITSRGSSIIYGRSDSTLKRMGVRMGSSEIYSAVEELPEVVDSLILGFDTSGGGYFMPLFVVLNNGLELNDVIKAKIRNNIKSRLSPRHVPDDIFSIPEVPRTMSNKKLEIPVKKILMGTPIKKAVNVDSMSNPQSIEIFLELGKKLKLS